MDRPPRHRWLGLWLGLFLAAGLLYGLTARRGACWQDSGLRQWRVIRGDWVGHQGLALAHPGWVALGRGFVAMNPDRPALMLNLLSAVAGAVAVANLGCIAGGLTSRRWIGAAVGAMFAVSHAPWWLATVAEAYTTSLALLRASWRACCG